MKYCSGFLLLEMLLALSCLCIVSLYSIIFLMGCCAGIFSVEKKCLHLCLLSGAYDHLVHDLSQAPSEPLLWKKQLVHEVVWRQRNRDIGFLYARRRLVRCEGDYDSTRARWTLKNQSMVLDGVDDVTFEYHVRGAVVHGVTFVIHYEDERLSGCASCRSSAVVRV